MPQSYSLLRYPGGKTYFAPFLHEVIRDSNCLDGTYVEPFAGSAGAALKLLVDGHVSRIVLGDADPVVCAFWHLALRDGDVLDSFIRDVELSLTEWERQRQVYFDLSESMQRRSLAFFFLNRTNRSGVLSAGPIGGKSQSGQYLISARFSRDGLRERLDLIRDYAPCISISCTNAISLCRKIGIQSDASRQKTFVYLDPPYFQWGKELYNPVFSTRQHKNLATALVDLKLPWVLSCDDTTVARECYGSSNMASVGVGYSIARRRTAAELLVWNDLAEGIPGAAKRRFGELVIHSRLRAA